MTNRRHRHKRYSDIGDTSATASVQSLHADPSATSFNVSAEASGSVKHSTSQARTVSSAASARPTAAVYSIAEDAVYVAANVTSTMSEGISSLLSNAAQPTTLSTLLSGFAADGLYTTTASSAAMNAAITATIMATPTHHMPSTTSVTSLIAAGATGTPAASDTSGLSTSSKAIVGGVVGGLGGLGLICALVLVVLNKGNKRKRPESAQGLHTPQRYEDKQSFYNPSSGPTTPSRMRTALTLVSARHRSRKNSEPPSPTTPSGFQVISGRRLSSPPQFLPGMATRNVESMHSSPGSTVTSPSRRSRLGGTPTIYRDPIGRSQEMGSTISHTSRFIEAIE